jgi:hypothetical protein
VRLHGSRCDGDRECEEGRDAEGEAQARGLGDPADDDRAADGPDEANGSDAPDVTSGHLRIRRACSAEGDRDHGGEADTEEGETGDGGGGAVR